MAGVRTNYYYLLPTVLGVFAGILTNFLVNPPNKNPPWLESLRDGYPLLSNEELDFIADVHFKIMNEIQSRKGIDDKNNLVKQDIIQRTAYISRLKADFKRVTEYMRISIPMQNNFLKAYPDWRSSRDFTVKVLEEIADKMDIYNRNCRLSNVVGSLTSFIGGGLSLMSGCNDANFFKLIGSIMMSIGTVTSGGLELAEAVLLHQNVDRAKEVVKKDSKNLEVFLDWLKLADELSGDLDSIKSVDDNLQAIAKNIEEAFKGNLNKKGNMKGVGKILKSLNFPPEIAEEIADGLSILVSTTILHDRYRVYFELVSKTSNCLPRLKLSMTLFKSALSSISSVSSANKYVSTLAQKRLITAGMLMDAYSMVRSALENPESIEGRQIRDVAHALRIESDVFKVLYDKMKILEKNIETRTLESL